MLNFRTYEKISFKKWRNAPESRVEYTTGRTYVFTIGGDTAPKKPSREVVNTIKHLKKRTKTKHVDTKKAKKAIYALVRQKTTLENFKKWNFTRIDIKYDLRRDYYAVKVPYKTQNKRDKYYWFSIDRTKPFDRTILSAVESLSLDLF